MSPIEIIAAARSRLLAGLDANVYAAIEKVVPDAAWYTTRPQVAALAQLREVAGVHYVSLWSVDATLQLQLAVCVDAITACATAELLCASTGR